MSYLGIPYTESSVTRRLRFRTILSLHNLNREAVVNATYCPDFCIQGTTGLTLWCRRSRISGLLKSQHPLTLRCQRRR
ncbi:hypothetical protein EDD22DRAFT_874437 [Suillus occidentalis]|nr:hypothetical protein EDD22DRAFT_874437 [Suillus occidentalis]